MSAPHLRARLSPGDAYTQVPKKAINAGGLKIEAIVPFEKLRVTYDGRAVLLDEPGQMADPSQAFKASPALPCTVALGHEGGSPMFGGAAVNADASPLVVDPKKSCAQAPYEPQFAASRHFTIGDEHFGPSGHGLHDKSSGPRRWQVINWYRWCPMNFGRDFGILTYTVEDRVQSLIPLRNQRQSPDRTKPVTRIRECFGECECNGMTGYGISAHLDQIVDGRPLGC